VTFTPLAAHLGCALLVGLDVLARGLRTRACLRGCGHPLPLTRVLEFNLWAEAAAALTPFRIAGEPSRIGGMLHAGVPLSASVVTSATEGAINGLAVMVVGLALVFGFAPEWWDQVGPAFMGHLWEAFPVVFAFVVAIVLGIRFLRRRPAVPLLGRRRWRDRARELVRLWAEIPRVAFLYSAFLSGFSVCARTLLLPLLVLAVPGHAGFGVLWLGSYMMVYSQLLLPVPAGAGAVDLAFLGGVAGDPGSSAAALLIAWRGYSLGVATVVGTALALHRFGARPLVGLIRGRIRPGPDVPGP
jgi:uncharacterized membrane protein YbhN (UPF0104 family)